MFDMSFLSDVNEWLPDVNRVVGVFIALFGAFVVAPAGSKVLRESFRQRFRALFSRGGENIPGSVTGSGGLSAGVAFLGSARGRAWDDPGAAVEERIETLHRYIAEIEGQLDAVNQRLGKEVSSRERAQAEFKELLETGMAELRRLLDDRERQSAHIDARALPVIATGIVLSGVPDLLALPPYGIGWVFPILGTTFAGFAWVLARRDSLQPAR